MSDPQALPIMGRTVGFVVWDSSAHEGRVLVINDPDDKPLNEVTYWWHRPLIEYTEDGQAVVMTELDERFAPPRRLTAREYLAAVFGPELSQYVNDYAFAGVYQHGAGESDRAPRLRRFPRT